LIGWRSAGLALLAVGAALAAGSPADPAAAADSPGAGELRLPLRPDEAARGSASAPLTMVEFTDYQCPYCRRFQAEVWPRLKHDYVDTGKLRFIVRDLPLSFHAHAQPAAEAAHCAAEQGRFWPMHDALLASGSDLSERGLEHQAGALGLDVPRFEACVAAGRYAAVIARNAAEADALGLRGTPAFLIGTVHEGELRGQAVMGAMPYGDFAAVIREALAGG
jgi:protein-disulfide isomerase